jgi:TRAP-type C4-dicarboxylate transport system permease small subunit
MSNEPDPSLARVNPPTRIPLKLEEAAAAVVMGLLVLITLANVVARYLTNISFAFTEEISIVLMVIGTLLGASVAEAANRHIRISWFVDNMGARGRRIANVIAVGAVIVLCAVLVGLGVRLVWDEWRFEVTSPGLGIDQWLYTMWMPILLFVVMLRAIGRARRVWRGRQ